jgi:hypothetical protein
MGLLPSFRGDWHNTSETCKCDTICGMKTIHMPKVVAQLQITSGE